MVLDTSSLLAVIFNEKHGPVIAQILENHASDLRMSTVNLAETLILIEDRQPQKFEEISEEILTSTIRFIPPSIRQSQIAAQARLKYPLNLGDCFAYALAKDEGVSLLTLDSDFAKSDISLVPLR